MNATLYINFVKKHPINHSILLVTEDYLQIDIYYVHIFQ